MNAPSQKSPVELALEFAEARTSNRPRDYSAIKAAYDAFVCCLQPWELSAEDAALRIITEDYRAVTALNARLQVQLTALLEELPVEEREKIRKI